MTQAQLAEAADFHDQFVSQLEREERSPAIETIDAIAAALGVEPWELLRTGAVTETKQETATIPAERIRTLLKAWSGKDQERLVKLLVDLRVIALRGTPATRKAPLPKTRKKP